MNSSSQGSSAQKMPSSRSRNSRKRGGGMVNRQSSQSSSTSRQQHSATNSASPIASARRRPERQSSSRPTTSQQPQQPSTSTGSIPSTSQQATSSSASSSTVSIPSTSQQANSSAASSSTSSSELISKKHAMDMLRNPFVCQLSNFHNHPKNEEWYQIAAAVITNIERSDLTMSLEDARRFSIDLLRNLEFEDGDICKIFRSKRANIVIPIVTPLPSMLPPPQLEVGEQPEEAPQPEEVAEPEVAEQPEETPEPDEAAEPEVAEQPEETPEPDEAAQPAQPAEAPRPPRRRRDRAKRSNPDGAVRGRGRPRKNEDQQEEEPIEEEAPNEARRLRSRSARGSDVEGRRRSLRTRAGAQGPAVAAQDPPAAPAAVPAAVPAAEPAQNQANAANEEAVQEQPAEEPAPARLTRSQRTKKTEGAPKDQKNSASAPGPSNDQNRVVDTPDEHIEEEEVPVPQLAAPPAPKKRDRKREYERRKMNLAKRVCSRRGLRADPSTSMIAAHSSSAQSSSRARPIPANADLPIQDPIAENGQVQNQEDAPEAPEAPEEPAEVAQEPMEITEAPEVDANPTEDFPEPVEEEPLEPGHPEEPTEVAQEQMEIMDAPEVDRTEDVPEPVEEEPRHPEEPAEVAQEPIEIAEAPEVDPTGDVLEPVEEEPLEPGHTEEPADIAQAQEPIEIAEAPEFDPTEDVPEPVEEEPASPEASDEPIDIVQQPEVVHPVENGESSSADVQEPMMPMVEVPMNEAEDAPGIMQVVDTDILKCVEDLINVVEDNSMNEEEAREQVETPSISRSLESAEPSTTALEPQTETSNVIIDQSTDGPVDATVDPIIIEVMDSILDAVIESMETPAASIQDLLNEDPVIHCDQVNEPSIQAPLEEADKEAETPATHPSQAPPSSKGLVATVNSGIQKVDQEEKIQEMVGDQDALVADFAPAIVEQQDEMDWEMEDGQDPFELAEPAQEAEEEAMEDEEVSGSEGTLSEEVDAPEEMIVVDAPEVMEDEESGETSEDLGANSTVPSTSATIWKSPNQELDEDEIEYNRMVESCSLNNSFSQQSSEKPSSSGSLDTSNAVIVSPTLATQDLAGTCGQPIQYASNSSDEAQPIYRMENRASQDQDDQDIQIIEPPIQAARNGHDDQYQRSLEQQQLLRMAAESAMQESLMRPQANWHQDSARFAQPAQAASQVSNQMIQQFAPYQFGHLQGSNQMDLNLARYLQDSQNASSSQQPQAHLPSPQLQQPTTSYGNNMQYPYMPNGFGNVAHSRVTFHIPAPFHPLPPHPHLHHPHGAPPPYSPQNFAPFLRPFNPIPPGATMEERNRHILEDRTREILSAYPGMSEQVARERAHQELMSSSKGRKNRK